MKNYVKDIVVCIKRLYDAEKLIDSFIRTGGQTEVLSCLDLDGERTEPHPMLKYSNKQKKIFILCFGEPLKYPNGVSPHAVKKLIEERRNFYRLCVGMMDEPIDKRFLDFHNYLTKNDPYIRQGQIRIGKKSRGNVRERTPRKEGNMAGTRD